MGDDRKMSNALTNNTPWAGSIYASTKGTGAFWFVNEPTNDTSTGTKLYAVISSTGLGLGTSSPYAKLSIAGTSVASTTLAIRPVSAQTANILDIYNTSGTLINVISSRNNWGIGTTTPATKLQISSGANATTTVSIDELGLTSSKACANMNRSDGGAGSFFINAAETLVAETNYCR